MALVPTSIVSEWYCRSSWVYRSFSYLFSNPLWDKQIPSGFSLCPLFWCALFSLFIFRPFVYALLGLRAIIKPLNLDGLIRWTDGIAGRLLFESETQPFLMPTFVAFTMLSVLALLISGIVIWGVQCWAVGAFAAFVLPISLFFTLSGAAVYWAANEERGSDRCPVYLYVRAMTVACLVAGVLWYPAGMWFSFVEIPLDFLSFVLQVIVACFGLIWSLKGYIIWGLIGLGLTGIAGWLSLKVADMQAQRRPAPSPTVDRRVRLRQLADVLYRNDDTDGWRSSSWYWRILNSFGDILDRYILGDNWDAYTVAADPELQRRIREAWFAEREKKRLFDERCKRVTAALGVLLIPFAVVGKQACIVCAYLWQLVKASKSKACPYIRFTD